MIHSLVIGLTLAVTSGSDFTSLTTAIIFHQLFEGLSLGIRIAALPRINNKLGDEETGSSQSSSTMRTAQPSNTTTFPQLVSIDDEEAAKPQSCRNPSPAKQTSRISQFAAWLRPHHHHHHQNHRAGSDSTLWERESSSPVDTKEPTRGIDWLKLTLSLLFAITTPLGMGVGMVVWTRHEGSQKDAQMLLTQGLMSAISAGLLIYAATVEMIAGDFVFGDVEGHGHHHHGGPNTRQEGERGEGEEEGIVDQVHRHEHGHNGHGASSMGKKALAVVSLLAGVLGMVLVGLGE